MVRERFFDYLQYEKRYSSHTVVAYRNDINQFSTYLQETYEVNEVTEVTHQMVRSWLASLIENGFSARSTNRKLSSLKTFYKYLLRNNLIKSNPVRMSTFLRVPERLPSFATEQEMKRSLKEESDDSSFQSQRDFLVLHIFYHTGIRLSELIGLKVRDIDFYNKSIKVIGKRNKERFIPVSAILLDKISRYLEMRTKVVIPGVEKLIVDDNGMEIKSSYVAKIVKEALTKAGVTGKKSPHVLRHTFATLLLNEGADLNAIKEILGHSSLASTQVYTHTSVEKLKEVYNQAHPWAKKGG